MKHEKIFRNKDGSRTRVTVSLFVHSYRSEHEYSHFADHCPKGKRTWHFFTATQAQIEETKLELWNKLKP